jgi:hypothetical protein
VTLFTLILVLVTFWLGWGFCAVFAGHENRDMDTRQKTCPFCGATLWIHEDGHTLPYDPRLAEAVEVIAQMTRSWPAVESIARPSPAFAHAVAFLARVRLRSPASGDIVSRND